MVEENTESDVAKASEAGSNLPGKPVESVNDKKQESLPKKGNDENIGIEETIEAKTGDRTEDSDGKEDSTEKLVVEGNEQTVLVPQEDADSVSVESKEGETIEVVELVGEKNDSVEHENEPKEGETKEVDELGGEKNDLMELDKEPQKVVPLELSGQVGEIRLTLGQNNEIKESDAPKRISEAAAEDETENNEMLSGINEETKASSEDSQMKAAIDVNDEEMEDKIEVKEGKKNKCDVDKEKMEVELEHKADQSDNDSIGVEINLEGNGLDVKKESETEQTEGKLEGSTNEEDKQEDEKGTKKRKRKGGKIDDEVQKTNVTSVSTRPVRERKSVERLVASVEKEVIREIFVERGPGVALIDIPSVAHKLSKKTNDETFKQLHTILFGRRGKAIQMKNNVSQFSGFVWHDNEEKNKMKVREKFDKLVKEKLIEFCDVLDIPIANKVSTKKEDVVTRLMEFLACPHPTTDELLSEKEHSEKIPKRKRSVGPGLPTRGSAKNSGKRKRTSEKLKQSAKGESESERESDKEDDEAFTENQGNGNSNINHSEDESSEKKISESDDAMDEDPTHRRQRLKKSPSMVSAKRRTKKSDLKDSDEEKKGNAKSRSQSVNKLSDKTGSTKKARSSNVGTEKKKQVINVPKKEPLKTKNDPKGKSKEEKLKPSDKVLRNQICQILKEVDFNTATFTDILKLLGKHFKTDLTPRKASIKLIIQEELTKMADAADEEEEEEQTVTPEPAKVSA